MKVKQVKINKLARKINKANAALYDAIDLMNDVLYDDVIRDILNDYDDEHTETIKKLAIAYDKLNKKYNDFINVNLYSRDFDDFDKLTAQISDILYSK